MRSTYIWILITAVLIIAVIMIGDIDRMVAVRTFALGLGASAIALPLGVLIAWVCHAKGFLPRTLLLISLGLVFVPLFIHVTAWDSAFGKLGWISSQSKALTPLLTGWSAAIWIHGLAAAPQVGLLLWFGMAAGGRAYEEQALMDASRSTVFWRITLRRLLPLIALAAVWIFVTCSREIAVTDIYQIGTLAEQIYLGYSSGQMGGSWTPEQIVAAQTTSWILTAALVFTLTLATISIGQYYFIETSNSSSIETRDSVLHTPSTAKNIVAVCLLLLIAVVPFANLLIRGSFFVESVNGQPTPGYSLEHLGNALHTIVTKNQSELIWSSLISVAASTLLVVVGVFAGWFARGSKTLRWALLLSIAIACATPGPLIGTLIVKLFTAVDIGFVAWLYDRTIAPAVLAVFIFCWPLSSVLIWFNLRNTATDALEHATLEGAGGFTRLFRIGIAANWAALVGCWLISFAICFGELSASHMTIPPGIDTVPRLALGWLHAGVNEMTAALTIVTVALIVGVSALGWFLFRLKESQNNRQ